MQVIDIHHAIFAHAGSHGGNHVEVEGSFDNWTNRQVLQRTGKDFTIIKLLPPGVYQVCSGCMAMDSRLHAVMKDAHNTQYPA